MTVTEIIANFSLVLYYTQNETKLLNFNIKGMSL
jgi:hypothetical protein